MSVFSLRLIFLFPVFLNAEKGDTLNLKIDTTIVHVKELTGDDKKDTIRCHLLADNWKTPITVTYTVISNNKIILHEKHTNDMFDDEFGTTDMDGSCTGDYLSCKKKWYYNELPGRLIKTVSKNSETHRDLLDMTNDYSIPSALTKFYRDSLHLKKKECAELVKKYTNELKKRDIVLMEVPVLLKYFSFPRLYDPKSGSFVMIIGY